MFDVCIVCREKEVCCLNDLHVVRYTCTVTNCGEI